MERGAGGGVVERGGGHGGEGLPVVERGRGFEGDAHVVRGGGGAVAHDEAGAGGVHGGDGFEGGVEECSGGRGGREVERVFEQAGQAVAVGVVAGFSADLVAGGPSAVGIAGVGSAGGPAGGEAGAPVFRGTKR